MGAFDHARSLEKGLLFCQQRVIRLIGPSPTRTPPTERADWQLTSRYPVGRLIVPLGIR